MEGSLLLGQGAFPGHRSPLSTTSYSGDPSRIMHMTGIFCSRHEAPGTDERNTPMFALHATVTTGKHSLSRVWLSPEEAVTLMRQVTYLHPALTRSDQWDRVEVSHSRLGLVAWWSPETGWIAERHSTVDSSAPHLFLDDTAKPTYLDHGGNLRQWTRCIGCGNVDARMADVSPFAQTAV